MEETTGSLDKVEAECMEVEDEADSNSAEDWPFDHASVGEYVKAQKGGGTSDDEEKKEFHKKTYFQDRVYQRELLELAKRMNIIICLPTGTGKTRCAVMLADHMLPTAIENNQKIVFVANSVPLVQQQANYFSNHLTFTTTTDDKVVKPLTGDLNTDYWKKPEWDSVMSSCHIIVSSTQIIYEALNKGYIRWEEIALLILDECHHAQKGHPMSNLMNLYREQWDDAGRRVGDGLPKVLGLTATIIMGNKKLKPNQIETHIEDVEQRLVCKAVTNRNYEEMLKRGWTIFLVKENTSAFLAQEKALLAQYFQTGRVPEQFDIWYQSRTTNEDGSQVQNPCTTILQVRSYESSFSAQDPVCQPLNEFINLLKALPKNFGTMEEDSVVSKINHPSLTSEQQVYNYSKGIPQTLQAFLQDLLVVYTDLGPYCCWMAAILKVIQLHKDIQELEDEIGDTETGCGCWNGEEEIVDEVLKDSNSALYLHECAKTAVTHFIKKLEGSMANQAKMENNGGSPSITRSAWTVKYCVSNKVSTLWNILSARRPHDDLDENKLCGLIFCKTRLTAQVMRWYWWTAAKEWPEEMGFIEPDVILGQSTAVGDTEMARYSARRQKNVVRKFRKGELNLLVATQVVEEGLDVPACNLVIRQDSIDTYPSFVQSLGRARKKGAVCYAVIDRKDLASTREKFKGFAKYNEKLSAALERNAVHVGDEDYTVEPRWEPIPAYMPRGPDGPRITAAGAIDLVYRYCDSLSCDKIATLDPTAWCEEQIVEGNQKMCKARILLPIMSPVREVVEGEWMPSKTLAKRSAFMKCCILLDQAGELTENLLPKERSIEDFKCEFLDKLKEQHEQENMKTTAKIGTRKRAQWYAKYVPPALTSVLVADCPISVYKVNVKLVKFKGDEEIRDLYNFDQHGKYFGIVTCADLSGLPKFRLQDNYGELEVSLKKCSLTENALTSDQLEALRKFQDFLRDTIYGLNTSVLKIDPSAPTLIAPLIKECQVSNEYAVDWSVIQAVMGYDSSQLLNRPSEDSRKNLEFVADSYTNAVVVPWYKKKKMEFICTIRILTDTNATSPFDNPSVARTFVDYYKNKKEYEVDNLFHPEYPLILCKNIGTKLNFLKEETKRKKEQQKPEKLVPELVNVHVFPASLYVQGKYLPSIMHRVLRLMTANELRLKVAQTLDWNVEEEKDGWGVNEVSSSCELEVNDVEMEENVEPESKEMEETVSTVEEGFSGGIPKIKKTKRKIILPEEINPLEFTWELLDDDLLRRKRNSRRDTKISMPEPPSYKSTVCNDLINIDNVKCYHFDSETDFSREPGPRMETVMEALTLKGANDNVSLERLEVMGDSVLKLVVSLHVFCGFPRWDEGKMTQMRMKLISNLHLYQLAKEHKVGELLSGSYFIPNKGKWLPTGFTIPEDLVKFLVANELDYGDLNSLSESDLQSNEVLNQLAKVVHAKLPKKKDDKQKKRNEKEKDEWENKTDRHTTFTHSEIRDKSVADCMEAIIGAYYMNGGIDGAIRIMGYLGMRGPLEDGSVTEYSRQSTMTPVEPDADLMKKTQRFVPYLESLEETICYRFKNPWLAVEALTHPTFIGNRVTGCYERLEFIGDAILDFLVTNYILKETNISDPGEITDLRAALVNNVTFGSLAVKFQFHKALKYESDLLKNCIARFVEHQEEKGHLISDPCHLLSDLECHSVREIEVPKVLGDVWESIAGAVFVDSGMSIDTVWKIFYRLMKTELEQFSKKIPKSPIRLLYEMYPAKNGEKVIKFRDLSKATEKPATGSSTSQRPARPQSKYQTQYLTIPGTDIEVRGEGATIKHAKQAVAKYVLRFIRSLKNTEGAL